MKSHKTAKAGKNTENDWSSRSGFYHKLSDPQKKMDKIIDIMDKEELDN